jgi:hypothetical protein
MIDAERRLPSKLNGKGGMWGVVGIVLAAISALIAVGAFPRLDEIATKRDTSALDSRVKKIEEVASELRTESAVAQQVVQQLVKGFERMERYQEALNLNVQTLMREVEIPEKKIARPPRREEEATPWERP